MIEKVKRIEPCAETCQRGREWWHRPTLKCKLCGFWPKGGPA